MPRTIKLAIACSAVMFCNSLYAATIMRCSDNQGRITYTLHGCPETSQQSLQSSYNPTPGSGRATPMAKISKHIKATPNQQPPTVVGTREDGCGNILNSRDRRSAIIQQRIRQGMSEADVVSSLGKPERITRNNDQTRYYYSDSQGNHRQVSFVDGCVTQRKKGA